MQPAHPGRAPCAGKPCARGQIGARARRARVLILGAVLAGGRSSRFGSDKAQALLHGRTLVEHARAAIGRHVTATVVVGTDGVPDLPCGGLGPLGGIAGALHHAAAHGFDSVLTIACDMPAVPGDLIAALLAEAPAYCPDAPVLGHWPTRLEAQLLAHLRDAPERSVRRWARAVGAAAAAAPYAIANVNTPADLASL